MYKKKKVKAKFKFRIELLGIFVAIGTMAALAFVLRLPDAKTKISNSYVSAGGSLTADHLLESMSFDELYEQMSSEEYTFVYFGSTSCSSCVNEIGTINTRAAYYNVETLYYVDATNYIIDEDADDYEEDKELTAEITSIESKLNANIGVDVNGDAVEEISLEFTPAIWVFKNNELIFNSANYLNDDQDAMKLSWTAISDRAFCVNLPVYGSSNTTDEE